jgi:hypothetical protein
VRLAQGLHDVVSHNVSMIAVQAGAADVLLDQDPERTRESLRAIEGAARARRCWSSPPPRAAPPGRPGAAYPAYDAGGGFAVRATLPVTAT